MHGIAIAAVDAAEAIDHKDWARLCPPRHPFLNPDFLAILERHGAAGRRMGWRAHHLVARDEAGSAVGILPLYLKSNSHGEFIHDWGWAAAYRQLGQDYYPKLFTGLPHTPAGGRRLLAVDTPTADSVRQALVAAAKRLVAENGLSSWHVAFPAEDEADLLEAESLLASYDVQYQWFDTGYADFEGYLAAFSAEKRRKVRAERRRVQESGLVVEIRHGDEVDAAEWPALHALYASTFDKFGNYAALSAACLAELGATLGPRMVVFIAREWGDPVAVSLCFRSDEALYGRYWGCRGNYHSLHFELCFYQGIAYCLREGLRRFEPGAGGEHKIARGFTPTVVRSFHWVEDPNMRRLISLYLLRQHQGVREYCADAAQHLPFKADSAPPM